MRICLCTWYDENIKDYADLNYEINKSMLKNITIIL